MFGFKNSLKKRSGIKPYIPGQNEPSEYTRSIAELTALLQKDQLDNIILIVGFDDSDKISTVLQKGNTINLKCLSIEKGPTFKERNPVVVCKYPLKGGEASILEDAHRLKQQEGTDLSAIGINMDTAIKLREIFGKLSCPLLMVSKKFP